MGRLITISSIMAVLIAFSCFTVYETNRVQEELGQLLDQAEICAVDEDFEKAAEVAEEIEKVWDSKQSTLLLFTNHSEIDQMTEAVAQLQSLIEYENQAEFRSEIDVAREILMDIYLFQLPIFENVL